METQELPPDWATDFDLYDEQYLQDPFTMWAAMRAGCPVAHTRRWGGAVLPVRHGDIARIARDPETFSSRAVEATGQIPERGRELRIPPITSDPPEHDEERRLLLPLFTKPRIRELEDLTKEKAAALIDGFVGKGAVDAADEYARHIPVTVISHMLGVPPEDELKFGEWVVQFLKVGPRDPAVRVQAIKTITQYFRELMAQQRDRADQGLVGYLQGKTEDGHELTDEQAVGMCFLLLVAGIDTTWSTIGSSLWHLATHPEDRRRLVREPELLDTAIEEFLRAYAPITIGRTATRPVEVGDHRMKPGERVLLSWGAANRDPDVFERADEVLIDREENRHLAFGLGIHRCIGSNLARMELKVALSEWLQRIPEFELSTKHQVTWTGGNVRGPEALHLVFPSATDVRGSK
jgi:cytochrome P450